MRIRGDSGSLSLNWPDVNFLDFALGGTVMHLYCTYYSALVVLFLVRFLPSTVDVDIHVVKFQGAAAVINC